MSRYYKGLLLLLALFLISTSVVSAQEDYDGIVVPNEEPSEPAPVVEETPTLSRTERLNNLRNEEFSKFQSAADRRINIIALQQTNTQSGVMTEDPTMNYRLDSILVSARYHKTLDLYLNYLSKISQSQGTTSNILGFDGSMDRIERNINDIALLLNDMDSTIDSTTGGTEADLATLSTSIQTQSEVIKAQLEDVRMEMLELVGEIE